MPSFQVTTLSRQCKRAILNATHCVACQLGNVVWHYAIHVIDFEVATATASEWPHYDDVKST